MMSKIYHNLAWTSTIHFMHPKAYPIVFEISNGHVLGIFERLHSFIPVQPFAILIYNSANFYNKPAQTIFSFLWKEKHWLLSQVDLYILGKCTVAKTAAWNPGSTHTCCQNALAGKFQAILALYFKRICFESMVEWSNFQCLRSDFSILQTLRPLQRKCGLKIETIRWWHHFLSANMSLAKNEKLSLGFWMAGRVLSVFHPCRSRIGRHELFWKERESRTPTNCGQVGHC